MSGSRRFDRHRGIALGRGERTRTDIRSGQVVSPSVLIVRGKNGLRKITPAGWRGIKLEKDGQSIDPDQLPKGDIATGAVSTKSAPPAPAP